MALLRLPQMADETLNRIFGTILGAFSSKYLGQALQGIAEKVRGILHRRCSAACRPTNDSCDSIMEADVAPTLQSTSRKISVCALFLLHQMDVTHHFTNPSQLVEATTAVYNSIRAELLPTPSKSHYTYNLRDVSKVCSGNLLPFGVCCPVV